MARTNLCLFRRSIELHWSWRFWLLTVQPLTLLCLCRVLVLSISDGDDGQVNGQKVTVLLGIETGGKHGLSVLSVNHAFFVSLVPLQDYYLPVHPFSCIGHHFQMYFLSPSSIDLNISLTAVSSSPQHTSWLVKSYVYFSSYPKSTMEVVFLLHLLRSARYFLPRRT